METDLAVLRDSAAPDIPVDEDFEAWVSAALAAVGNPACSLAINIVDESESRRLNLQYRGVDRPTNVLSFPADLPADLVSELDRPPLGDLAICAPRVISEAAEQGKTLRDHWAHLTVHGILHLLGHDHEDDAQAEYMESMERSILAGLGVPDPYAATGY